jgi:hypothetical protein
MAELIEVELAPGEPPVLIEVTSAGGGDVALHERLRLDEVGEAIRSVSRWAEDQVRSSLPEAPAEFEVSFGVKLGVKSGRLVGILAEASGEASLNVRMLWK